MAQTTFSLIIMTRYLAKKLPTKRLGFTSIGDSQIQQLEYDNRYCGFKHTTSPEEVKAIKAKQTCKSHKKNSNGYAIKVGFFAATVAAASMICYRIFTNHTNSTPKI